ncbi:MAG: MBL fold metallo-hydrolase [Caldivirga sp.]|uniref:MBL fold metallo-hydrolase n=1 Tax=Caldivirga sp. TaxID=2080243 RepID=UPI003D0CC199
MIQGTSVIGNTYALSRRGLKVNDIDYVVLTHLHYDHAINALIFKNTRVILSEKERDYALIESVIRTLLICF